MIQIFAHYINADTKGGLAVLATHNPGDSFIRVYTEPCSTADQYNKKVAVDLLRKHAENGIGIRLPINTAYRRKVNHQNLRTFINGMFGGYNQN